MFGGNPSLDQLEEILCFRDNLFGLGMGRDGSMVIVDHIALPPARLEKVERGVRRSPKRQTGDLKGQAVMARCGGKPKSRTGDGHGCCLQSSIVGGSKPAIVRQFLNCSILEIANDHGPQVTQLFPTCLVCSDFAFGL